MTSGGTTSLFGNGSGSSPLFHDVNEDLSSDRTLMKTLSAATQAAGTSAESLQKTEQMNESFQKFLHGTGQGITNLQDSLQDGFGIAQEGFRNLQAEVRNGNGALQAEVRNGNDAVQEHLDEIHVDLKEIHVDLKNDSQGVLALMKGLMDNMRGKLRSLRSTNKDQLQKLQKVNARVVEVESKADTFRTKASRARSSHFLALGTCVVFLFEACNS